MYRVKLGFIIMNHVIMIKLENWWNLIILLYRTMSTLYKLIQMNITYSLKPLPQIDFSYLIPYGFRDQGVQVSYNKIQCM